MQRTEDRAQEEPRAVEAGWGFVAGPRTERTLRSGESILVTALDEKNMTVDHTFPRGLVQS